MSPRLTNLGTDPVTLARRLLGQRLVRLVDGQRLAGIIVETEAYLGSKDRAAHSFNGRRTPRNESMYLPGGHAYVYFTYGMHHCFNVVCGRADEAVAVLVRALEPTEGLATMHANRQSVRAPRLLCSGPGRLAAALRIDRSLDGEDLITSDRLWLERVRGQCLPSGRIGRTSRIGVDSAGPWARRLLRFVVKGSPYVSR